MGNFETLATIAPIAKYAVVSHARLYETVIPRFMRSFEYQLILAIELILSCFQKGRIQNISFFTYRVNKVRQFNLAGKREDQVLNKNSYFSPLCICTKETQLTP